MPHDPRKGTRRPGQKNKASAHQAAADDLVTFLTRERKLKNGEIESHKDSPRAHNAWIRDQISDLSIDIRIAKDALIREMRSAKVTTVRSGNYTFTDAVDRFHIQEQRTGQLKGGRGDGDGTTATVLGVPIPRRTLQALSPQEARRK